MHKTNVLTFAGDLWQRTFDEVAAEYPDVATAYNHVDAACIYFVQDPGRYDVIVTDNLFGDILTDLGGAVSGGIGLAASANLNPARTGPSLFEPVHGSAPDIVGTGKANPTAAILSAAMMLDFLGEADAAARIQQGLRRADRRLDAGIDHRDRRRRRRPALKRVSHAASRPTEKIWMNGELVDWDDAKVHILTHTLHYGTGVFEGIRAYETAAGPGRLPPHRPHRAPASTSAKILMMDIPYTRRGAGRGDARRRCGSTGLPSCYIRPIVYLGYGEMGSTRCRAGQRRHRRAGRGAPTSATRASRKGVRMKISSWPRHDPNTMPPAAKTTGNYINSSLAKVEALKAGYDEAIMLNPQGYVSECTGENIFVVRNGRIITPPLVRRRARGHHPGLGDDHRPRPRHRRPRSTTSLRSDLYIGRRDVPLRHRRRGRADPLGRRPRDRRAPGPITRPIQESTRKAVRGEVDRYKDWVEHVR